MGRRKRGATFWDFMKTYFEASTVISSKEHNVFERFETCIRIVPIKFTYTTSMQVPLKNVRSREVSINP